jgi:diguanylate cyclase (GGDEF)-like protein
MRWTQQDYQLNNWWPEFDNQLTEKKYRTARFKQDAHAIAHGVFVLSLFFMAFVVSDQFLQFTDPNTKTFNTLLKLSMAVIGFGFYHFIRNNLNPLSVNRSVLFFIFIFCTGSFISFSIYSSSVANPITLLEMSAGFAYLTLMVYIFVPLTFKQQLVGAVSLLMSAIALVVLFHSLTDPRIGFAATLVFGSNLFGIAVSYTINKNFRAAWANDVEKEKDYRQLKEEIKRREKAETLLKKLAMTDALTGIDNRRSFMDHIGREKKRADRQFTPLSLVTFDIDLFKHINDEFGHDVGDKVLVDVSKLVTVRVRETDVFARIGGEEFAILMPDSEIRDANKLAESIRLAISEHTIMHDLKAIKVTSSFGVAEYQTNEAVDILLRRADKAMYKAKNSGRNCVSVNYR